MMLKGKRDAGSQTGEELIKEWLKVREDDAPQSEDMSMMGRTHSKTNARVTPGLLKYQQLKERQGITSAMGRTTPSEDVRLNSQAQI